jgi:hypothetical protein
MRGSATEPSAFLRNELNLDTFKEYLSRGFPGRALEAWDGQARHVLDRLKAAGYKTLQDVDHIVKKTTASRDSVRNDVDDNIKKASDGTVPSSLEIAFALSLSSPLEDDPFGWSEPFAESIGKHRASDRASR